MEPTFLSDGLAHVKPDTHPRRANLTRRVQPVEALENFQGGAHRMGATLGVFDGSSEDRHEAVTEKLVHDSLVFIDDVDHEVEQGIQIRHYGLRPLPGRVAAEVANIQKHHADVAQFAAEIDRLMK